MHLPSRRRRFDPWVGKTAWRRKWQPTPVFLPEESYGERSRVGYCPWGHKESDMTEWLTLSFFTSSTQQQRTISQSDCNVWWEVNFIQQSETTSSVVGLRRSPFKALPKAKLAPKKGHGHCLVICCTADPLQLSESYRNHYIWEVFSANQWDASKMARPVAGIGQQKGPNPSPQCLTTCLTANASKVEQTGL